MPQIVATKTRFSFYDPAFRSLPGFDDAQRSAAFADNATRFREKPLTWFPVAGSGRGVRSRYPVVC